MTNEASINNPDLTQQPADLTARIAQAREVLNFVDRSEIESAQYVAQLRSIAAGKGPLNLRIQALQNARRIETKNAKSRAATRASANAVLIDLQGELDVLPRPDDGAH